MLCYVGSLCQRWLAEEQHNSVHASGMCVVVLIMTSVGGELTSNLVPNERKNQIFGAMWLIIFSVV